MKGNYFAKLFLLAFGVFLLFTPMQAHAENYCWDQKEEITDEGEVVVTEIGWYKGTSADEVGSTKIDAPPEDLSSIEFFTIHCEPDAECLEWLENLSGEYNAMTITSFYGGTFQIGNGTDALKIGCLNAYSGNFKLYGDVDYVRTGGPLEIYGDVAAISLGEMQGTLITTSIMIDGNVDQIYWYDSKESQEYACGYAGDLTITGTVKNCDIYTPVYDSEVEKEVWIKTGIVGPCQSGVFSMTSGVLANGVVVRPVTPDNINYTYTYQCSDLDTSTRWVKQALNDGATAYFEECTIDDIPNNAYLAVYGTGGPVVIEKDLDFLSIELNGGASRTCDVTIKGNVNTLYLNVYGVGQCDLTITGNVGVMNVYYVYNPNYNITINGKSENALIVSNHQVIGWFDCDNLTIIENGDFSEDLLIRASIYDDAVAYVPISTAEKNQALVGNDLGTEIVIDGQELVKDARIDVKQSEDNKIKEFREKNDVLLAMEEIKESINSSPNIELSTEIVCGAEIDINTFYKNKESGEQYQGYVADAAPVTELQSGKKLTFDVKIPNSHYDSSAKYAVVRSHYNADGSESIDVLPITQNGDMLTFASDKFSSFMIVKVSEEEKENTNNNSGTDSSTSQPSASDNQEQTTVTKPDTTTAAPKKTTTTPGKTTTTAKKEAEVKVETETNAVTEVPDTVTEVTPIVDKDLQKAVEKEVEQIINNVLNGDISEEVMSKETLKKVKEAQEKGEGIITEVVVDKLDESKVDAGVKEALEKALSDGTKDKNGVETQIAQYLDLTVLLKATGGEELGTINKLSKEITFTIAVPEELEKDGRTFVVLRMHEGETTVLETEVNADGTLSFKTDRFSTYALAYVDVVQEEMEDDTVSTETETSDSNIEVDDNGNNWTVFIIVSIVVVIIVAIIMILLTIKGKKKE